MTLQAHADFGRSRSAVQSGPTRIDKWRILDALTDAAESFGIGHRHIGVLKALLSFHPDRHWPVTADTLVVFPSNRTLAQRLGGMPDSTLRRHLSRLVAAGLLARQSSPNGKRYRRGRGGTEIAFGLDLAPLLGLFGRIQERAEAARQEAEACAGLRAQLLDLRHRLRQMPEGQEAHLAQLDRALRRKLDRRALEGLIDATHMALSAVAKTASDIELDTSEPSVSNSQNERHIEHQKNYNSDTKAAGDITLEEVNQIYKERYVYFPAPLTRWRELFSQALQIGPMLGLKPQTIEAYFEEFGDIQTSLAILTVLERFDQIDAPMGYLAWILTHPQHIPNRADCEKLSADNSKTLLFSMA